ncbi:UNVERIFIED_CONTAM: hypothetical protein Slati_0249300 [Sesamum latifolium]|uniref:Ty3-gypsy retrotransposon protein n=1 Tax=Sesamum latifolium TaxID=2727402 RepID=A0AAW2YCU3_9LAMI
MSKKIKNSSQMTPFNEYVKKDLGSPNHASEDDENKSPPFSPRSVSSHSFTINMALVMMTNATIIEEQLAFEAHDEAEVSTKQRYTENDKSAEELQVSSDEWILVDQLKEFIEGIIRSKIKGSSKSSLTYSKPYIQRIDNLKIPMGYQPSKFQQFDGKGNPKQHVAHFIETCNNVGIYGDHLVKNFVRSLKGNAFDWYTDLEASSLMDGNS